jgi:hypothetical protein
VASKLEIKLFAYIRIEDCLFPMACKKIWHQMTKGQAVKSASTAPRRCTRCRPRDWLIAAFTMRNGSVPAAGGLFSLSS